MFSEMDFSALFFPLKVASMLLTCLPQAVAVLPGMSLQGSPTYLVPDTSSASGSLLPTARAPMAHSVLFLGLPPTVTAPTLPPPIQMGNAFRRLLKSKLLLPSSPGASLPTSVLPMTTATWTCMYCQERRVATAVRPASLCAAGGSPTRGCLPSLQGSWHGAALLWAVRW